MNSTIIDYLVCPDCQANLECTIIEQEEADIISGTFICNTCQKSYPIIRGIPRFVTTVTPLEGQNIDTADAFGWEWQEFSELHSEETYKEQFLDWIAPIQPAFFQDKVVLDAGCGMGRFSLISGRFGAKQVLAIDASDAVESAQQNTKHLDNVSVIQGDINNLPLRKDENGQIDFAFSIGVLHHLDDPEAGFNAITHHLQPKGTIFGWVYGRENNGWLVNIVNPIRTVLTSRLPRKALYALSWLITIFLHPIVRFIYRPVNNRDSLKWLSKILVYNDYLAWLGQFGFRHNHHVVFDHLVAPVAFYLRKEEFQSWFEHANMTIIDLSWRNQNSWRGHGRFTNPQAINDDST